jgi:hypothetical protein
MGCTQSGGSMTSVPHSGAKSVTPGGSVAGGAGHTKGPWYAVGREVRGAGSWTIAQGFHTPDGAVDRNARLIAAAPDLLKTLEDLRDWLALLAIADADDVFRSAPERLDAARAAIAKATAGETRNAEGAL